MRLSALFVTWISLMSASCVSVNLGSHDIKHAADVHFTEPGKPFSREASKEVDAAWKNHGNGNLLSYLSDCQDESDPSLDSILEGALGGVSDLHLEKKDTPMVQGREARRVLASGKVDGVPSEIDLLVFKRDSCIYILSYVGVRQAFAEDHAQFDHFVEGFKAP